MDVQPTPAVPPTQEVIDQLLFPVLAHHHHLRQPGPHDVGDAEVHESASACIRDHRLAQVIREPAEPLTEPAGEECGTHVTHGDRRHGR